MDPNSSGIDLPPESEPKTPASTPATPGKNREYRPPVNAAAKPGGLPPGHIIDDRYRIDQVIGTGGMSIVYRARHLKLDRDVALKILKMQTASEARLLERFLLEARAESALKHPNILAVHALGMLDKQQLYLSMDYLEGQPLSACIRNGPLDQELARDIFRQICDGLQYAHEHGVIHRDLKPSNIMILGELKNPLVKIVDFGLAKFTESHAPVDQKLTKTGMIMGTPAYMSPEQAVGMTLDCRSDIYSFGCLMYEVLTGKLPFTADSEYDMLSKHITGDAPPFGISDPNTKVSPAFERLVLKAMANDPGDRFASCAEIRQALEDVDLQEKYDFAAMRAARARKLRKGPSKRAIGVIAAIVIAAIISIACFGGSTISSGWLRYMELPRAEQRSISAIQQHGQTSPEAIAASAALGDIYTRLDQPTKATAAYQLVLNNIERADSQTRTQMTHMMHVAYAGINPTQACAAALSVANTLRSAGDVANAERAYSFAGHITDAAPWARVTALNILTDMLMEQQRYREALTLTSEVCAIAEQGKGPERNQILGELYMRQAAEQEALHMPMNAVDSYRKAIDVLPPGQPAQHEAIGKLNRIFRRAQRGI